MTVNRFHLGMWVLAAIAVVVLLVPVLSMTWMALDRLDVLDDPQLQTRIGDALRLSAWTTTISMVVVVIAGTPLAWALSRSQHPLVGAVDVLIDLPIVLPPAVAGIALLTAFGRQGWLGPPLDGAGVDIAFSSTAVIIAQVFVAAPFYIRSVRAGLLRLDPVMAESAADLGATPFRVFWRVTLPLVRTAMLAGLVLAWARALGEFGATLMFAGNRQGTTQTMPLAIYERFSAGDLSAAIVMSILLMAMSLLFLVIVRRVDRG